MITKLHNDEENSLSGMKKFLKFLVIRSMQDEPNVLVSELREKLGKYHSVLIVRAKNTSTITKIFYNGKHYVKIIDKRIPALRRYLKI